MNPINIPSKEKININNSFEILKSNVILKKIFNHMNQNKLLKIVKYNKNLQERLNLNINDYDDLAKIEIEIKPDDNKYGEFINIPDEETKYFHIYFHNSNKEIKKNKLKYYEKVNSIKIIIDYQIKSFKELFSNCECISSIIFKKFYRNNITDMSYMFSGCSSLKELNLSNFNTKNVIYMNRMLYDCSSLKELNLSNFNTNNVTDMNCMFYRCSSLKELNLSKFNTNNVTDMVKCLPVVHH